MIDYIFQIIGLILGIFVFKQINWSYRLICFQLFISLCIDLIADWSGRNYGSNYLVYNIYMPLEVLMLSFAGILSINRSEWKLRFTNILYLYSIITVFVFIFSSIRVFNTNLLIFGFIILGSLNLYLIIDPDGIKSIKRNPMMIISIAHILYFCAVTPLFVSRTYMLDKYPEMTNELYQLVNRSLMLVRYFLISIAMIIVLINARTRKPVLL